MTDPKGRGTRLRAALYVRCSRQDSNPALQNDEGTDFIARRNWDLVEVFADQGVSGSRDRRPALDRVMEACRKRKVDVVVVWRADRLFRSLKGLVETLSEWTALGIQFVSVTEPFDTTTPTGRLLLHLVSAFAEFERGIMIERTLAGQAAARRRGARIGRPPVRLPEAKVREMHAKGMSLRQIAREFKVSSTHVHNTLKRPEGCGPTSVQEEGVTVVIETPGDVHRQMGRSER